MVRSDTGGDAGLELGSFRDDLASSISGVEGGGASAEACQRVKGGRRELRRASHKDIGIDDVLLEVGLGSFLQAGTFVCEQGLATRDAPRRSFQRELTLSETTTNSSTETTGSNQSAVAASSTSISITHDPAP